jgi:hypothetical protein
MQIFHRQRRGDLVMTRRNVEWLVLIDTCSAIGRGGRTKAMIECGLQRRRVVRRPITNRAKAAILGADWIIVGEEDVGGHDHAPVVIAVQVVPPSVLM